MNKKMNIILKAENIHKLYKENGGELHVLRGVNLKVYEGEIVTIMGPSGSGKSTLLHILGGLDRPTEGAVWLDGEALFPRSNQELARIRNRKIGFVFQFHQLLPEFTALENVLLPRLISGEDGREDAKSLIREVELEGRENHPPAKLSGGERQRVAVARALINNPKLVLADEPSGNLDREHSDALHSLIKNISETKGLTFVIVTHKESLKKIANRVMQLENGKLIGEREG
jgi:ABC-type lipoprotein export system ATPase subunit